MQKDEEREEELRILYGKLQIISTQYDHLTRDMPLVGTDTALAIGQAMGYLAKAKALLRRDIDQCKEK